MHKCHNQSVMRKTESLTKLLEQDILAGKFRPGEKLPSIRQLMEIYSLSKGTVERSIESLCKRGFLEKRAGSGSFVTDCGVFDDTIEPGAVTVLSPLRVFFRADKNVDVCADTDGYTRSSGRQGGVEFDLFAWSRSAENKCQANGVCQQQLRRYYFCR